MQNNLFSGTITSLSWEFPQGLKLFSQVSFTLGNSRYGLVGPNGVGKSTLAKILAGKLEPQGGEVGLSHPAIYIAQEEVRTSITLAEYLAPVWDSPHLEASLMQSLLGEIAFERSLFELSGGEWVRVRILLGVSAGAGLLILDEPTNSLDQSGRKWIHSFVKNHKGALLIISHDRSLLTEVDFILELSNQGIFLYGGGYDFYAQEKVHERSLLSQKISRTQIAKKKREREYVEKLKKQDKRNRTGADHAEKGGMPRILLGARKRQAQQTTAKIQVHESARVESVNDELRDLQQRQKRENFLGLQLPIVSLPDGKLVFEFMNLNFRYGDYWLWNENLRSQMRGPRRWAITGGNGAGKTTLLKIILQNERELNGTMVGSINRGSLKSAYIDQDYHLLDKGLSILENIRASSDLDESEIRNRLAHFQFYGDKVFETVEVLSGGEKLKACLAKVLMHSKPPQLLVLDEPTNNLDLGSLEVLEKVLTDYKGALLVVSHDEVFLDNIGIDHRIELLGPLK